MGASALTIAVLWCGLALRFLLVVLSVDAAWLSKSSSWTLSSLRQGQLSTQQSQRFTTTLHDKNIEIPILYESDRLLIINKPHGIAHHNDRSEDDNDDEKDTQLGIVNLIRNNRDAGERLWGVHRLDRVTSGILILAKDVAMAQALTASFANGQVAKIYMGISARRPTKKKQGWVQGGMVKSRDKSWKLTRDDESHNFCKTRFFTAPILCQDQKLTLLLFRPYTGKTHQLRVAAKSMGLPLWGDPIYKNGNSGKDDDMLPAASRTYLHASGILLPPLLDMPSPLAVWCQPPFQELIRDDSCISHIMQKHCDVPEILAAMQQQQVHDLTPNIQSTPFDEGA